MSKRVDGHYDITEAYLELEEIETRLNSLENAEIKHLLLRYKEESATRMSSIPTSSADSCKQNYGLLEDLLSRMKYLQQNFKDQLSDTELNTINVHRDMTIQCKRDLIKVDFNHLSNEHRFSDVNHTSLQQEVRRLLERDNPFINNSLLLITCRFNLLKCLQYR